MGWTLVEIVLFTVASLTLYQWGASIWKGKPISEQETKWIAVFLWISAFNFAIDVINKALTLAGVGAQ